MTNIFAKTMINIINYITSILLNYKNTIIFFFKRNLVSFNFFFLKKKRKLKKRLRRKTEKIRLEFTYQYCMCLLQLYFIKNIKAFIIFKIIVIIVFLIDRVLWYTYGGSIKSFFKKLLILLNGVAFLIFDKAKEQKKNTYKHIYILYKDKKVTVIEHPNKDEKWFGTFKTIFPHSDKDIDIYNAKSLSRESLYSLIVKKFNLQVGDTITMSYSNDYNHVVIPVKDGGLPELTSRFYEQWYSTDLNEKLVINPPRGIDISLSRKLENGKFMKEDITETICPNKPFTMHFTYEITGITPINPVETKLDLVLQVINMFCY